MKNILLITTMYPDPVRPCTEICHYYTREWVKMGYNVVVVNFRSMFPYFYTLAAKIFPKLALKYVGNHVEMDRNQNIIQHQVEGIPVYSIPIFKFKPHGKYPKKSITKNVKIIQQILSDRNVLPDAIIGHFYNPQLEIVGILKEIYPQAKTCVSLHEIDTSVIKKCYPHDYMKLIQKVDVIGCRSETIRKNFFMNYGSDHKSLVCWSGASSTYLETPSNFYRKYTDFPIQKFLFVGQTTKQKRPKETIEAIHQVYGKNRFLLTYVGSRDNGYDETVEYIQSNNLSNNVEFVGKVSRDKIIDYYDKNECFILISKNECFGLVYLEALARGCITIASKNEGMEGIIQDGVNGFFCNAGDVNDLARVIKRINALNGEEKQMISDNAKKRAQELSDYNIARKYIDDVLNA